MLSGGEPWSRDKSADFERLIKRIGGFTADGLPADGPLDYDDAHFERAAALVRREAEPSSADEVRALAAWFARYPDTKRPALTGRSGRGEDINCDKSKSTS